jgi:hypothetical protein
MNVSHPTSLRSAVSRRRLLQTAAAGGVALSALQAGRTAPFLSPGSALAQTPAPDDLTAAAVDAWLYGYPLLSIAITGQQSTNVTAPQDFQAPPNQFASLREFPDASFTAVVAPNVDTLYSSAFLDLAAEPIVFQWPDMGDRYFLFPILDGWSDVVMSPGSRTTGEGAGTLVIAGPDWVGTTPAGIDLPADTIGLRVPTNLAWVIGRIYCSGTTEDYAAVHAIQDQLRLVPLSAWGSDYTPPAGTVDAAVDMTTAPVEQVNTMAAADYFGQLADLIGANPPSPADAPILSSMAALGIEPGKPFDFNALDPAVQQALEAAPKAGLAKLPEGAATAGKMENGWLVLLHGGDYGTDYLLRAYVALLGLGANLPEDALYPDSHTDSAGQPLDGTSNYVVHFDSDPPVKGFWSLTAYTAERFLVPNALNRFALRGNDPLVKNADGSFDLYLQAKSPGADKEANWLPVPAAAFSMTMRAYWPEEAIIDGTWKMPTITKAS